MSTDRKIAMDWSKCHSPVSEDIGDIESQVDAFFKAGGKVQKVPFGVQGQQEKKLKRHKGNNLNSLS